MKRQELGAIHKRCIINSMQRNEKTKNTDETLLTSKELINVLNDLLISKEYKKKLPSPKFNMQELRFIRDLVFWKPKGLLFHYLADDIMNNTIARDMPMFNAPSLKKLRFIQNLFSSKNAKEAAIKAGFSPKTAKQQASRILKELNGYRRPS